MTTKLPRELAPWAGELTIFPRDLAVSIGPWVRALSLAIGPLRTAVGRGSGEPDGFSGLARRGGYERLLASEWLLADEAPDEFLRRAASSEHAFFALARRHPAPAATSVAIFDAGPDALGSPRLAHLAALVVLARRAAAAKARFAWGILQTPSGALSTEVTPASVLALLRARTACDARADDLAAYRDRARASGWDDVWLVGGAAAGRTAWPERRVEARDVLDPERRSIDVVVRAPGGPPRSVVLDLPDDRTCARLLRDPFAVAIGAPRRAPATGRHLAFSPSGAKILARSGPEEVVVYPVPGSPNEPLGRPRIHKPWGIGSVLGIGWATRGVSILAVREGMVTLEHTRSSALRRKFPVPDGDRLALPEPDEPPCTLLPRKYAYSVAPLVLDARQRLVELGVAPAEPSALRCIARGVLALRAIGKDVWLVARAVDPDACTARTPLPAEEEKRLTVGLSLVRLGVHGRPGMIAQLGCEDALSACIGPAMAEAGPRVAFETQPGVFRCWDPSAKNGRDLHAPPGAKVLGVAWIARERGPELLLLDADEHQVALAGRSTSRVLWRSPSPIREATTSAPRPSVAFRALDGTIGVYSLEHDRLLATFVAACEEEAGR